MKRPIVTMRQRRQSQIESEALRAATTEDELAIDGRTRSCAGG
jgi:hypothetical protein